MRILVADDDMSLCDTIKRGLVEHAYAVDCVHDGEDACYYAETTPYDLVILDIMMPVKDGLTVCRALRDKKVNVPVLMLTARDTVEDRVRGLDMGADDYLVKPFAFAELLARVRALLRRRGQSRSTRLQVGDLALDTATRQVTWRAKPVELTTKEFAILQYLMHHPQVVVTRTMIEQHVWDYDFDSMSNLVDVYIRRIRQKIDADAGKQIITTIRGAGYRLG